MVSPIDIEVVNKLISSVAEEMGIVLQKAAFSPNIKERRDFSCAVFNRGGKLLAQAAHIPVHLGAMPQTIEAIRNRFRLQPGDIIITNDPFLGGTHLPDLTLVTGVFRPHDTEPMFLLVSRAHHADIGGITPGSMPLATKLDEEGLLVRPALLVKSGQMNSGLLADILSGVRHPEERRGDIRAQIAALERGRDRLLDILAGDYAGSFLDILEPLLNYGERVMRNLISSLPDGTYTFDDAMDDDGIGATSVPIHVEIRITGDRMTVDFAECSDQVRSGINTVRSVTCSATYYVLFCLVGEGYPVNAGSFRPIDILTRPGSLLDAVYPAPVAAGNVETSQRIVDCLLGALSSAAPLKIPAASCGSMNNVAIGGRLSSGGTYAYYETIGGGMGGRPGIPGISGIQNHMTNTLNTPIEVLEQSYPFLIERYSLRRGSGGRGHYHGGDGIIRRYRFKEPATVTLLTERRRHAPYGLNGGEDGTRGRNLLYRNGSTIPEILPGKVHLDIPAGDALEIRTPGGGGWGSYEGSP